MGNRALQRAYGRTVRMLPKHSSATVLACAEPVSISAVYFMLRRLKTWKEASRKGRQPACTRTAQGCCLILFTGLHVTFCMLLAMMTLHLISPGGGWNRYSLYSTNNHSFTHMHYSRGGTAGPSELQQCVQALPERVLQVLPSCSSTGANTAEQINSVGRRAPSVSELSSGLVMNMSTTPNKATTEERSATLMEMVPALFISRVSCMHKRQNRLSSPNNEFKTIKLKII